MTPFRPLMDARKAQLDWRIVAAHLLRLEAGAPLATDGQPWIRVAEAASGYSANHLRRMTTAFGAISVIERHWPKRVNVLRVLPFSHAEILARLWNADPDAVGKLLQADQWPSYGELLTQYEQARARHSAPVAAGKLAAGKFRAQVGRYLSSEYGAALLQPTPYHPYMKPDFIVLTPELVAWDCLLLPARIDEEALRRRFLSWATEASFVTAFWVVTQDSRGIESVAHCIAELELHNIGLMSLGPSGLVNLLRPSGPPEPDRRKTASNVAFMQR